MLLLSMLVCLAGYLVFLRMNRKVNTILKKEKSRAFKLCFGAGSRGRTDTVLLPSDFESDASANSTIPAKSVGYYNIYLRKNQ